MKGKRTPAKGRRSSKTNDLADGDEENDVEVVKDEDDSKGAHLLTSAYICLHLLTSVTEKALQAAESVCCVLGLTLCSCCVP